MQGSPSPRWIDVRRPCALMTVPVGYRGNSCRAVAGRSPCRRHFEGGSLHAARRRAPSRERRLPIAYSDQAGGALANYSRNHPNFNVRDFDVRCPKERPVKRLMVGHHGRLSPNSSRCLLWSGWNGRRFWASVLVVRGRDFLSIWQLNDAHRSGHLVRLRHIPVDRDLIPCFQRATCPSFSG